MTKKYNLIISKFFLSVFIVIFVNCGMSSSEINAGDNEKINIDPVFNETALFLAGKEIPETSKLYKYSRSKEYLNYCKQIESNWERMQELNEKKIIKWKSKYLSGEYTDEIYYPFSGPDILNALTFFPEGKEYLMFGLESPGDIPQPQNVDSGKLRSGLRGLLHALNTMLNVNFFKTNEMKNGISTNDFDSVISVMMFFLARMDYEVLNVRKVWIDEQSYVTSDKPQKKTDKTIPGTEIFFRRLAGKPVQKVAFFRINVNDSSMKNHQNYISYMERKGRLTTIIKSASYLMHRNNDFTRIRNIILIQSDYLLQDDSGIPLKFFTSEDWKLTFHGEYKKPIKLFAIRYQADLSKAFKEKSTGLLDFSYGYNFKEHDPNLMFAERIKR